MKSNNLIINTLLEKYQKISKLNKIIGLLDWDTNVNLPQKGSIERADQVAFLTEQLTNYWLDKDFKNLLEKANIDKSLDDKEKAIIRNLNHSSQFFFKVPKEIIIEKAKTTSEAFMVWQTAKNKNRFKDFLPYLKKIIKLNQIIATHLGYKENPYDALLNLYEPGLTTHFTSNTFTKLQPQLTTLLKKIQKSKDYQPTSELVAGKNIYHQSSQRQLAQFIIKKLGYDLQAGRLDISSHPFETTLGRQDIRITTRFKETNFIESFTSAIHETGHALYEQGIDEQFSLTPLEGGVSYAIHESQSRFWENIIGRNPVFIEFITPILQAFYPENLSEISSNTLVKLFNQVKPSLIRVEADEITYGLHIILRFELENELINNKLKPEDLPKAWNNKMKKYLDIQPKNDTEGVLQDVHWSYGYFGYFPTYALGNLYAAQFANSMRKEIDIEKTLQKGEFATILFWLRENIHQHGVLYWPNELIKRVTGETLNPKYFIDYLNKKYSQIYSLPR